MVWATGEVLGREEYISMHFADHHEEDVCGFVSGEHSRERREHSEERSI
jgi:hypothetical protein